MIYNYGINITSYNRFSYLKTTLESFKKTIFLPNTVVIITDDASTDPDVITYLQKYTIENSNVTLKKNFNKVNLGSKENYHKSLLTFLSEEIDFIINLDSDTLFNKEWMVKNDEIIKKFGTDIISSSFCCKYHHGNPNNKLELLEENFFERDTLNGLGVCFPIYILQDFLKPTSKHFDEYLCKELKQKYNMRCICTKDSYMQHIGLFGVHSGPSTCDVSDNFLGE